MRAIFSRWWAVARDFARARPLGGIGAAVILLMIAAALLANFLSPYDPLENDYSAMLQAPGARHWLGTDSFGPRGVGPARFCFSPGGPGGGCVGFFRRP